MTDVLYAILDCCTTIMLETILYINLNDFIPYIDHTFDIKWCEDYVETRDGLALFHRGMITSLIDNNGTRYKYKNGMLHGKPAIITRNGSYSYYKRGLPHREDGPAMVIYDGSRGTIEQYYIRGLLHREDGPAVSRLGLVLYYRYNRLHREDGPAKIHGNYCEYWRNGIQYWPFSQLIG